MDAHDTQKKEVQEQEFLFDKAYTCPICGNKFKAKTVKSGKAKMAGSDMDLRTRYEQIDMLKYDIIMCPDCGYAALDRFFNSVTSVQVKNVKEKICATFKPREPREFYTYDEALDRYKLALANAMVKQSNSSEQAYICLKTAWVLRGKAEHLDKDLPDYEAQKKQCEDEENRFLKNALDGLLSARQTEPFPMCGMDEPTVDYIIGVTAMRFEQYDLTSRLIAGIIQSREASPRLKDRARDVKAELTQKIKENNAAK